LARSQYDLEKCLLPIIDMSENLEKLLSMKHELWHKHRHVHTASVKNTGHRYTYVN